MEVKSLSRVPTLSDPMDRSLPSSFIHGIFQARVLEWGAIQSTGQLNYKYKLVFAPTVVTNLTQNQFEYIKLQLSFGGFFHGYTLATDKRISQNNKEWFNSPLFMTP